MDAARSRSSALRKCWSGLSAATARQILRVYNPGREAAVVRVGGAIEGVIRTRMDEHGIEHVPEGRLTIAGGEVATLRVWPQLNSPLRHPDPEPTPAGTQPTLPV